MREVLSQDKIDMVNKTRKKITVKHYLNLYLKPMVTDEGELIDTAYSRHPVYVRITFSRLTAKIKSATDLWSTINEFNSPTDEVKQLLERESMFLIDHISRSYKKFEKITAPYTRTNVFDVNTLFQDFQYENYELAIEVDHLLIYSMAQFLGIDSVRSGFPFLQNAIHAIDRVSPLELLTYYCESTPSLFEFKKKYSNEIWTWKLLYWLFKSQNAQFRTLGASIVDFTHGKFKEEFIKSCTLPTPLLTKLIDDIESLINDFNESTPRIANFPFI